MNNTPIDAQKLLTDLHEWQTNTFPEANSLSKLHHLKKEVEELIEAISNANVSSPENFSVRMEYADCFMLLFGAAASDHFRFKDIVDSVNDKMEINRQRRWGKPDANGVQEHID